MTTQDAGVRSGLIRAAVVVWLLAGVFAMHGLTGNHDAASALLAGAHSAVSTPSKDAEAQPHSAHHGPSAADPPMDAAVASKLSSDVTVEAASDGHGHTMGDVCLAMLTALVLAILWALRWRSLRIARPVARVHPALPSIVAGPSPPILSRLCVLRT